MNEWGMRVSQNSEVTYCIVHTSPDSQVVLVQEDCSLLGPKLPRRYSESSWYSHETRAGLQLVLDPQGSQIYHRSSLQTLRHWEDLREAAIRKEDGFFNKNLWLGTHLCFSLSNFTWLWGNLCICLWEKPSALEKWSFLYYGVNYSNDPRFLFKNRPQKDSLIM